MSIFLVEFDHRIWLILLFISNFIISLITFYKIIFSLTHDKGVTKRRIPPQTAFYGIPTWTAYHGIPIHVVTNDNM